LRSHWRFATVVLLLLATGIFLRGRTQNETIPVRASFASFPDRLGEWIGTDVPMPQDVLEVLGAGDFLLRDYQKVQLPAIVNLFVAYIPTQRAGDTIHSPRNCLPGAGWSPVEAERILVSLPGQPAFPANRYIVAKGSDRQLVLYWYWAHGRAVASEYWAKFYLVADSIRLNRSDGSLIRVVTPLSESEPIDTAQQRLLDLSANVVSMLDRYVPR